MSKLRKETFFSRNIVTIVMIPSIIGIHWWWTLMQKNRSLVSANEEIDLPVVTFGKYCLRKLQGLTGSEKGNGITSPSTTAPNPATHK